MFVFVPHRALSPRPFAPRLHTRQGLPRMELAALVARMQALTPEEAAKVRRYRFLPLPHRGLWQPCVITDDASASAMQALGGVAVAQADAQTFRRAMELAWGQELAQRAALSLATQQPHFSAFRRMSKGQQHALIASIIVFALLLLVMPGTLALVCGLILGLFYLLMAALHLCAAHHHPPARPVPRLLDDAELPTYTVLIPLFRESRVLGQLLQALARLDYPADKLDIKLLVEEADEETRAALRRHVLPAHIEVLTVPPGAPQTKPRALNYGLAFARGDLLCIHDAEDVPHPGQLRLAASMFAALPEEVACLQAPLGWYNAGVSFFSRMLAVDYAAHFHVILPWLQALGVPLPLGGTSNHFRLQALVKVGGWDPFNVTEDADLGIRLARRGYRTKMLPRLLTLEEACVDYGCWRNQRARWLKGWLQTFLVHQRAPLRLWQEAGAGAYLTLYALLGAGVFAALAHPFFLFMTLASLWWPATAIGGFWPQWMAALGLVVFVAGYGSAFLSARAGLKRSGQAHLLPWLVLLPLYWLLISLAAWLALWDFLLRPHHWRKTEHGFFLLLK